ncbi:hypothetical protein [Rhizobium sp. AG207R]|uniref:hypothetical protein n=1 Tax=Rhizobium sp. AG207R TaxID=2802287 RepID=UPI0022ABCE1C|nr:hypothetical protein [Rhizobium sp. AG207R]MCZ3377426.1 hypothetical protein [Rhizobium sp. AG207R]
MKTLHPTKMRHAADYVRAQHHVVVDPSDTIEDVTRPSYWTHHVNTVRVHDLIDVIGENFDLTLRVTAKGVGFVETRLLRKWESEAPAAKLSKEEMAAFEAMLPDGYVVDHTPKTLWRTRLEKSGEEIVRNQKSKVDAIRAAVDHYQRAQGIAA